MSTEELVRFVYSEPVEFPLDPESGRWHSYGLCNGRTHFQILECEDFARPRYGGSKVIDARYSLIGPCDDKLCHCGERVRQEQLPTPVQDALLRAQAVIWIVSPRGLISLLAGLLLIAYLVSWILHG